MKDWNIRKEHGKTTLAHTCPDGEIWACEWSGFEKYWYCSHCNSKPPEEIVFVAALAHCTPWNHWYNWFGDDIVS